MTTLLVNGSAAAEASRALASDDRGFHYGDGVFETALIRGGRIRFFEDHLQRLAAGCERLAIRLPDVATLRSEAQGLAAKASAAVLKIVISRGVGQRGYRPSAQHEPTRVIALYPAPQPRPAVPITLRWCETRLGRNVRLAGIKHLNRLEQVLAQAEWSDGGIAEGLMLDSEGELISGTACNVFLVRDGTLVTADLRFCGVRGIMRAQVLRAAAENGIAVREQPVWPQDLQQASEVFVTNAVHGIRSVAAVGPLQWHESPVADRLRAFVEQSCEACAAR